MMKYGECRGAKPLCQESEGFPSDMISPPFLARKGARGDGRKSLQCNDWLHQHS